MNQQYTHIILGAGPASIQLAYFLHKKNVKYIVLEKNNIPGSFFNTFPRQRRLISVNKVHTENYNTEYNLRFDWNSLLVTEEDEPIHKRFTHFTDSYYPHADNLLLYLNEYTNTFQLNIQYNITVSDIEHLKKNRFLIKCTNNQIEETYECEYLFIGTGLKPNPLYKNIKHNGFYTYENMPMDPEVYKNKGVIILGGGNAAFEVANYINPFVKHLTISCSEKFAWKTHYPGHIRSINMSILDSYYLKLNVNLDWVDTTSLRSSEKYNQYLKQLRNDTIWNKCDIVILCNGFKPNIDFFKQKLTISTHDNGFPKTNDFYESIDYPNLFFLGALSQGNDYKHGTSAFIHGFRYNSRCIHQYLHSSFPMMTISSFKELGFIFLKRCNISSCMLHRFDIFGCIACIYSNKIKLLMDIPLSIIDNQRYLQNTFEHDDSCLFISCYLGYDTRHKFSNTFRQRQTGTPVHCDDSVFIHPILKIYKVQNKKTYLVHEIHLPENAFNEFASANYHHSLLWIYMMIIANERKIIYQTLEKSLLNFEFLKKHMYSYFDERSRLMCLLE